MLSIGAAVQPSWDLRPSRQEQYPVRFLLKQISLEDYTSQKATIDRELEHLRELHAVLKARTSANADGRKNKKRPDKAGAGGGRDRKNSGWVS